MWPCFERVFAPEEIFFPTMLALAGFMNGDAADAAPASSSNHDRSGQANLNGRATGEQGPSPLTQAPVLCKSLMHATWPKTGERANPVPLDDTFSIAELELLRARGFLFARKFKFQTNAALSDALLSCPGQPPPPPSSPTSPSSREEGGGNDSAATSGPSESSSVSHIPTTSADSKAPTGTLQLARVCAP